MNMKDLFKQAFAVKQEMAKLQKELSRLEVDVASADGTVRVIVSGDQKLRALKIDPDCAGKDSALLEKQIVKTVNQALDRSRELMQDKVKAQGLLDIPGLF